jgi:hypothetical protein
MMSHSILFGCVDREDLPDEVKPLQLLRDHALMGPMVGHGRGAPTSQEVSDLSAGSDLQWDSPIRSTNVIIMMLSVNRESRRKHGNQVRAPPPKLGR